MVFMGQTQPTDVPKVCMLARFKKASAFKSQQSLTPLLQLPHWLLPSFPPQQDVNSGA